MRKNIYFIFLIILMMIIQFNTFCNNHETFVEISGEFKLVQINEADFIFVNNILYLCEKDLTFKFTKLDGIEEVVLYIDGIGQPSQLTVVDDQYLGYSYTFTDSDYAEHTFLFLAKNDFQTYYLSVPLFISYIEEMTCGYSQDCVTDGTDTTYSFACSSPNDFSNVNHEPTIELEIILGDGSSDTDTLHSTMGSIPVVCNFRKMI